jgi:hypothetical protein
LILAEEDDEGIQLALERSLQNPQTGGSNRALAAGAPATQKRSKTGASVGDTPSNALVVDDESEAQVAESQNRLLGVQMKKIDSILAAVADAPAEMLEPALKLLIRIYSAIIDKPNEPKVRRIRWMSAEVQQYLASVPIAQDFLLASGFCIIQRPVEGSATGETEDVIVFEDDSFMTLLSKARRRLTRAVRRSAALRPVSSRLSSASFFKRMCSFGLKSPLIYGGEQC